ncbi:MAG: transposase, partial [Candidatus Gracilibacteria bacterium]|nr:transposase [Candidatus Gracilibacteria bacterium]
MNTEKFKNKFRIQSNRLSNFDYSSSGAYFVTICANNRENVFGEIVNGEIILNDIGQIVEEEILATEKIRKNVIIDEFVIMPNHVHVIIFLNNE